MLHRIVSAVTGMGITGLYAAAADAAINEGSYLSVGLVIAAVGAVAIATWHIRGGIERNRADLKAMKEDQDKLLRWMEEQRVHREKELVKENQRLKDKLDG